MVLGCFFKTFSDVEFYLDCIADQIAGEYYDIGVSLNIKQETLKKLEKDYSNIHEQAYNMLICWNNMSEKKDRSKQLNDALSDHERNDVKQETFYRENYQYPRKVPLPSEVITDKDRLFCKSHEFLRLGRFFGLSVSVLNNIVADNKGNAEKQKNEVLLKAKQSKGLNRQTLCNGLIYVKNVTMADKMVKMWQS